MPERRFEDKVSIDEVLKDNPQNKVLLAKIYIQAVATNGAIARHEGYIKTLETEMKNKIGWKIFTIGISVLSFVILAFGLLNVLGGG